MEKEDVGEEEDFEENTDVIFKIGSYNDIFSDFDPRPSSQRGLSEDFLAEARRAVISRSSEKIKFIISLPKSERNPREEGIITTRLKKHFKHMHADLTGEKKKILRKGIYFALTGIILMIAVTFLLFTLKNGTLLASFLTILLEPASWFLFWEGMDLVIFEYKRSNPPLDFSRRMSNAEILFASE